MERKVSLNSYHWGTINLSNILFICITVLCTIFILSLEVSAHIYLNDNENYPYFDGGSGFGTYVDRKSAVVVSNNESHAEIKVYAFTISYRTKEKVDERVVDIIYDKNSKIIKIDGRNLTNFAGNSYQLDCVRIILEDNNISHFNEITPLDSNILNFYPFKPTIGVYDLRDKIISKSKQLYNQAGETSGMLGVSNTEPLIISCEIIKLNKKYSGCDSYKIALNYRSGSQDYMIIHTNSLGEIVQAEFTEIFSQFSTSSTYEIELFLMAINFINEPSQLKNVWEQLDSSSNNMVTLHCRDKQIYGKKIVEYRQSNIDYYITTKYIFAGCDKVFNTMPSPARNSSNKHR